MVHGSCVHFRVYDIVHPLILKTTKNCMRKPIIGLACDVRMDGVNAYHRAGEKYAAAVIDAMGGVPVLIPALNERGDQPGMDLDALLDGLDGVLLPGSHSNLQPFHYGGEHIDGTLYDERRDSLALPLVSLAIKKAVPLLAVCRGFQEMNVVYGGTLYQHVHEQAGFMDHREDTHASREVQYGHAHQVQLIANGVLAELYGADEASVNSLHSQGVKQLGHGLQVEAKAADGLIEAFSDPSAPAFNLALQWHPEYQVNDDPFYTAIFRGFKAACEQRLKIK